VIGPEDTSLRAVRNEIAAVGPIVYYISGHGLGHASRSIELIRALRIVEGALETCARQILELLRRVPVLPCEAVERGAAREGEDDLLPRDAELAGRPVERGEDDLLGDLLEALRVSILPSSARIGDRGGRVRRSAESEIDRDECNCCAGGDRDRAHQAVGLRRPSRIGTSASSARPAAARKEREKAFVTARSSWSCSEDTSSS